MGNLIFRCNLLIFLIVFVHFGEVQAFEYKAFENLNRAGDPDSHGTFFEAHCLKWDDNQKDFIFRNRDFVYLGSIVRDKS